MDSGDEVENKVIAGSHRFAGILRLLAEAIADRIIEDEKRASLGLGEHETAQEPTEPPSVQEKGKEDASLDGEDPRPPPPV